jgi:hypothetical protein
MKKADRDRFEMEQREKAAKEKSSLLPAKPLMQTA